MEQNGSSSMVKSEAAGYLLLKNNQPTIQFEINFESAMQLFI